MTRRLKKWRKGKAQLAALKKSQEKHVAIEVVMRIRVDGPKRPICISCGHSVMSHGERDGKLFCYGCESVNQTQCTGASILVASGCCYEGTHDNTGTTGS